MIKVLSILQPWASLVVAGHKRIETRSWNTKYRGELYIHASQKWSQQLYDTIIGIGADKYLAESGFVFTHINKGVMSTNLPLGAIIGKVTLFDTATTEELWHHEEFSDGESNKWSIQDEINPMEQTFGNYEPNRFGWLLSNPVMFDKPIPAKGKLRIWNYEFIGYE